MTTLHKAPLIPSYATEFQALRLILSIVHWWSKCMLRSTVSLGMFQSCLQDIKRLCVRSQQTADETLKVLYCLPIFKWAWWKGNSVHVAGRTLKSILSGWNHFSRVAHFLYKKVRLVCPFLYKVGFNYCHKHHYYPLLHLLFIF